MKIKYILLMVLTGANAQYDPTAAEDVNETFNSKGKVLAENKFDMNDKSGAGSFPTLVMTGPFITNLGSGVAGENESILQTTSLGLEILGAGAQFDDGGADNRVADDFVVINGGWQIEEIEVYAYQTGEVASTITGVTMQIWDGIPSDPASTVVFGDTTTNVLETTGNTGVLRVTEETTGTADDRQITFNVVTIGQFFPEGTYWVDYQFTGSGASGPWVPPVTILGQGVTGNGLQQINTTSTDWIPYVDSGTDTPQQGFPILVRGTEPDIIFKNGFENVIPVL